MNKTYILHFMKSRGDYSNDIELSDFIITDGYIHSDGVLLFLIKPTTNKFIGWYCHPNYYKDVILYMVEYSRVDKINEIVK